MLALAGAACSGTDDGDGAAPGTATTAGGGRPAAATCTDDAPGSPEADAVRSTVEAAVAEQGLHAVLYRVTHGEDVVAAGAVGESLPGVPATPEMHVGVGNVAFAYLGTLLLLLDEDGTLSLDDTVATWLPDLDVPEADAVTLEMLVRNTSGYPDHVRNEDFQDDYLGNPFQTFTPQPRIDIAMSQPPWYEPGTAWSYSHTGHVILGMALEAAGGRDLATLLRERVIEPMGLEDTEPIVSPLLPEPVLQTYTNERDVFEASTAWNLSWSTATRVGRGQHHLRPGHLGEGGGHRRGAQRRVVRGHDLLGSGRGPAAAGGLPPSTCRQFPEGQHYGLGVIVNEGWIQQGPAFSGYTGIHAYLPEEDLAVAVVTVDGVGTEPGGNKAAGIWSGIAEELAPEHVPITGG